MEKLAIHLGCVLMRVGTAVHISSPDPFEKATQHIPAATLQRLFRYSGIIHRYIFLPTKNLDYGKRCIFVRPRNQDEHFAGCSRSWHHSVAGAAF